MSPPTAGIWRERWRRIKLAHCAVPNYGNNRQFWENKKNVRTVYLKNREKNQEQTEARLKAMAIPEGSRVLDIGSGPGTFAVPLAVRGCSVTAVEPSPVMREALAERVGRERVSGITVIPKRWEDIGEGELGEPFDAVIASYSLTMMDIGEAVLRMQDYCRGTVHIFWFLAPPAWALVNRDLWPLIHGGKFPGEPTANWLWQILVEMGIYANITVEPRAPPPFYATFDDAVREFVQRTNCESPAQEETVRNYLHAVLRQKNNGFELGEGALGAHIWWNVQHQHS